MKWAVGGWDRSECLACGLCKQAKNPFIPPVIEDETQSVDLAICGEAPGLLEDQDREYFVGPAGQLQDELVDASRWREANLAYFNSVQCYPGKTGDGDGKPSMEQVRLCRPLLLENLQKARPKAILAAGQWAARALTNDGRATIGGKYPTRLRSLALPGWPDAPPTTSSYHPAAVFHQKNPALKDTIISDLDFLFGVVFENRITAVPSYIEISPGDLSTTQWGVVSFDTEFHPETNELYSIALHHRENVDEEAGYAALVDRPDADSLGSAWRHALTDFLRQPNLVLVGHNLSADLLALWRAGVVLPKWLRLDDTLSRARFLWENDPDRSLETLAQARLGIEDYGESIRPYKRKYGAAFGAYAPKEVLLGYNYGDAYASWVLRQETEKHHIPPAVLSLLNRKQYVLAWTTADGQQISTPSLKRFQRKYDRRVKRALADLRAVTKIPDYDPRSQAGEAYPWKVLGWTPLKTGKEGPSLDADVLKHYLRFPKGPQDASYAKALLAYRHATNRADRLRNDFTENRDALGRVHAEFNTARAVTLRDSSNHPNYQNVTAELREIVVPRWPQGWITHADQKGLEPRIIAHLTDCKVLLEIFHDPARAGQIYEILGSEIMGQKIQKYDTHGRKTAEYGCMKETILATNYNAIAITLCQNIESKVGIVVDEATAKGWIDRYMAIAWELKDYLWDRRRDVLNHQEVVCSTGFVRHLPNNGEGSYFGSPLQKADAKAFKRAWNQGVNVDTQHTASLIAKLWALYVAYHLDQEGLLERDGNGRALHTVYLGPVHDSVSHDTRLKRIAYTVMECYRRALDEIQGAPVVALIGERLKVPLDIDVHLGKSWRFD